MTTFYYITAAFLLLNFILVCASLYSVLKQVQKPLPRFWLAVYLLLFLIGQAIAILVLATF